MAFSLLKILVVIFMEKIFFFFGKARGELLLNVHDL